MDDYYNILIALQYFFDKIGEKFRVEWIAEDILLWQNERNVKRHLEAFEGGKGLFGDFSVDVRNGHKVTFENEVWADRIFNQLTWCLSLPFAKKIF